MGNDGGTIAKRKDILSLHSQNQLGHQKKNQVVDDNETSILTTCALSSLPLYSEEKPPVVGDYKGKLYLKEKIIEYIIRKKTNGHQQPSPYDHVDSLSDLVDVNITWKLDDGKPTIECPITQESRHYNNVYSYLRPCGCVISYRVLEELLKHYKVADKPVKCGCPKCNTPFYFNHDIVIINPSNNEKHRKFNNKNYRYLSDELQLTHSKKPKKPKKKSKHTKKRSSENSEPVLTKKSKTSV